jgi:hypothetical protein
MTADLIAVVLLLAVAAYASPVRAARTTGPGSGT